MRWPRARLTGCANHQPRGDMSTHRFTTIVWVIALATAVCIPHSVHAQQADSIARRQQRLLDSLSAAVRVLQLQVDSLSKLAPAAAVQAVEPVQQVRTAGAYMNVSFV